MIPINVAIEDALSEAVARRVLNDSDTEYCVAQYYSGGGFGYLKKTIAGWNRAAATTPFLVLTDLDRYDCPPALRRDWLQEAVHSNLLFRVAVREVESWLLADYQGIARFLGISTAHIPADPEVLDDPKLALINVARRCRKRSRREAIVPPVGSTRVQGPGYNAELAEFVADHWSIADAREHSPSLNRLCCRLDRFSPVW